LSRNVGKELTPILKMVRYYHHTQRDIRKDRTSYLVRGRSLNARPAFVFDSYLLVISKPKNPNGLKRIKLAITLLT